MGALGHDAGHFAVSQKFPWINDVGVWGMSLLCNPILWQHQHTYAHHSHTNEFDHDPDLHHFHTLLRVHWKFRSESIHKYQAHWPFVMLAYALVVFGTCFWIPWGVIQSGSLYGIVEWTDRKRFLRSVGMMLHTFGYVIFIIVVPFWTFSSWCGALSAVTIHVAVAGIIFAIFSQINHLNEPSLQADAEGRRNRPNAERDPVITNSWAAAQVETSNNFCPNSTLWHLLSNGLNLQIEHHLFPGLNHSHLHHIAPVVRQTCIDFGVVYKSYDSWSSLMCATLEWLKTLSHECDADVCRQE
jgi:fatty acid desaturase